MTIEERLESIERSLERRTQDTSSTEPLKEADEINLWELLGVLWRGKWYILGAMFISTLISALYAISLPNLYKAEVLLSPAGENAGGGLAGMAGQLGGLASLAGVNLGAKANDKTTLAIEVLKSRAFITKLIHENDLLLPVMAAEGWDRESNTLKLDDDIYSSEQNAWLRKAKAGQAAQPSLLEAYERFTSFYAVTQDSKTNFVTVEVEFFSPYLAKEWVDLIVKEINREIKSRDVEEATESIKFLKDQAEKTPLANMQSVFFDLIEEQTKTVMFAAVRDEYVFSTLDPAVVAEKKSEPRRSLICLVGVVVGLMIGVVFVLFRSYFLKRR